jgi:hypothetical protein
MDEKRFFPGGATKDQTFGDRPSVATSATRRPGMMDVSLKRSVNVNLSGQQLQFISIHQDAFHKAYS